MTTLHYISFASLHAEPLTISARLQIPETPGPHPAVILLHGSAGPSGREGGYASALNAAGFATLEPDQWAPRALGGGASGRPKTVHETLPDVYGALAYLAARPEVDARRIGLMGFSFGGVATMLAATRAIDQSFSGEARFAAYLPMYPICHLYNRVRGFEFEDLVHAPIVIGTASLDEYDNDPVAGPTLARSLPAMDASKVRTAVFHGVHHGFDMPGETRRMDDPASHRGKGGLVTFAYDAEAAGRAHALAVQVFGEMSGRPGGRPR